MIDFKYYAEGIIEEFEKNYVIPTSIEEWNNYSEIISLYLAAKKYFERHF